jgi:hypothetical protein
LRPNESPRPRKSFSRPGPRTGSSGSRRPSFRSQHSGKPKK